MSGSIRVLLVGFLFASSLLFCSDLIEKQSSTQWTEKQLHEILNASPWVSLSSAGIRRLEYLSRKRNKLGNLTIEPIAVSVPIFYRIRLLTATPIREAWLRWLEIAGILESTVNIEGLGRNTSIAEKQTALKRYLAANPNDGAIVGDDANIIVGITLRIGSYESLLWKEESSAFELSNLTGSPADAVLLTDKGKSVQLLKYVPPGRDWFGARYYFPRRLSDGTPLLEAGDNELRFETKLNHHQITVKFNTKKMHYKGKLEL